MALAKYGGGIVQLSGSIGGNVFARNRFGNYVRPRTKPVNPHSARQESARAIVSYLAEYWHETLDDTERGLWGTYAAAVAMKNKLGETVYLTGFNHFVRTNACQLHMGEAVIEAAPSILSLPEKDPDLVCSEEDISAQTFSFTCNTTGWAANGESKFGIMLSEGVPQLGSRNQFNGPWRFMDYIDATEGAAGTGDYAASFAFALAQKVWFLARLVTVSGRVSEPWLLDPRTVEADV